ncbi:trypsin-like peptidase domain-containing protein [Streptomyces sp. CC219B]|uniref:effector-associated domain 2-containing protein n=1 Tax=Streptomyces sp. CC219B TaxID=3044574 RepID=UPI0024A949C1|nr:trypsin-like peptidase domain-containing protein [Streptomyces sp. CC219B]
MTGGLDAARVAEVLVRPATGLPVRRGSGYRVGDRWVLTAAHVVRDAGPSATAVRFGTDPADAPPAPARVALASGKADVALLELTDRAPAPATGPPAYGAVPASDLALPFTAVGYPRLTLRRPHAPCHASGTISALSAHRSSALELTVAPPESAPDPDRSPWEGMSGAAVWYHDTLIGLIGAHHRTDAPSRLTAVRVDRWYDLLTPAELTALHHFAGLPATPGSLTAPSPHPTLSDLPADLPLRELDGLVTALTAIPAVSDRTALALVLDSIDPVIAAMSPRSPALRPDVFGILSTCLRYRGTLDQLLEAIRLVEGDSAGVARMDQEAVELTRRHRGADDRRRPHA